MIYDTSKIGWQNKLAKDAGVSPSTLSDILTRKSRPKEKTAQKLAKATGVGWIAWVYPEHYDNPYLKQGQD